MYADLHVGNMLRFTDNTETERNGPYLFQTIKKNSKKCKAAKLT